MKYYCIGIKGSGMSTLAQMLKDLGNEVYGYDDQKEEKFTQKGLEERHIPIYYDGSFPLDGSVTVTFSKAFSEQHPEIQRAYKSQANIKPYNQILGEITEKFQTIAVCGTHGKTTTTSLLKHIFTNTIGCSYFIGDGSGKIEKDSDHLVLEADEFNRHFLAYRSQVSIVTCIELEHTEIYKDLEDIIETFQKFLNQNTKEYVIACGDDENIRKIKFEKPVFFYGEKEENDYLIKDLNLDQNGSSFTLYHGSERLDSFFIPLYGKHMVYNAAGAIIACLKKGISKEEIKKLLPQFKNAKRRFQETILNDYVIIDDYAHHPTEIQVTLKAIRQKYKDKKLIVIFSPNTYSRTAAFHKEFAQALSLADKAYVTPILCDRENPNDYGNVSSNLILKDLPGGELMDESKIDQVPIDSNTVVAFMGCATVSHLIDAYSNRIKNMKP